MINHRILVIDDEAPITFVVKAALEDKYDVETTTSVFSAFKYLSENKVDLVLLDIKMPQMNGLEALAKIKKKHPDIIVIMMSAYASMENVIKAKRLGVYGFITKPFDVDYLRNNVNRVLSENRNIERRA